MNISFLQNLVQAPRRSVSFQLLYSGYTVLADYITSIFR